MEPQGLSFAAKLLQDTNFVVAKGPKKRKVITIIWITLLQPECTKSHSLPSRITAKSAKECPSHVDHEIAQENP